MESYVERANSSVWATVKVAICLSSAAGRIRYGMWLDEEKSHTFLIIYYFTLVVFCHFSSVHAGIQYIARDIRVAIPIVRDCLEKRRATRPGAAEDEAHFAWLENTGRPAVFHVSRVPEQDVAAYL